MRPTALNRWRGLCAIGLLVCAGNACAALIHDLDVTNVFGNFTGSGQITFLDPSGNDPSRVSAFSFAGTGPQGNFTFSSPADIDNIMWSIDPLTWGLSLNLGTRKDREPTASLVATCLILDTTGSGGECPILSSSNPLSRVAQQVIGRTSTGGGNLITTAVHVNPTPEPGSLALLTTACLLAGITRRQRRQQ